MIKTIFRITNDLSQALQRRGQDIVNAISLVRVCKERLQSMRDDGRHTLLNEVSLFHNRKMLTCASKAHVKDAKIEIFS
jgi:hypothetical protein